MVHSKETLPARGKKTPPMASQFGYTFLLNLQKKQYREEKKQYWYIHVIQ